MKRIQNLSILLICFTLACNEAAPDTSPTDFTGLWSGDLSCSLAPGSETVTFNIQADEARCTNCYNLGFPVEGSEEIMRATEVNGELVIDRYIINEGGTVDVVSIEGTGRINEDGMLEIDFEMMEISGDNFEYTCNTSLTRQ